MSQTTKDKILEIAERLFGEQGYEATSLRHVIFEAGVNLAAVHYHFGSKEELLDAVFLRGAIPLNEERLALLGRYEKEAAPQPASIEKVLRAMLIPTFLTAKRSPQFVKLMGRLHGDGLIPAMVAKHFQVLSERFMGAVQRALPDLPPEEVFWRIQFMFGGMSQVLRGPHLIPPPPGGVPEAASEETVERLVAFMVAGFQAPPVRVAAMVKEA
jgi:AcrR family transcriptional regulator